MNRKNPVFWALMGAVFLACFPEGAVAGQGAPREPEPSEVSRPTPEELVSRAAQAVADFDENAALKLLKEALALPLSVTTQGEARLLVAKVHANYGDKPSWERVASECRLVLGLEGLPVDLWTAAGEALVPALLYLRQDEEAKRTIASLVASEALSASSRAAHQASWARILIQAGDHASARAILEESADVLQSLPPEPVSPGQRGTQDILAEIQLLQGQSRFEEGDNLGAKIELLKVLEMPGQSAHSRWSREALVRLKLRKLVPDDVPTLKVLFVGSSHTIRGNLPLLVEQIAASAPEGAPRVVSAEYVRTGTGMRAFWEEGEAVHTARGEIAAEAWDVVVVETFVKNAPPTMERYARNYADLVREKGARLVIYESPAPKDLPYPDVFAAFHVENVKLGRKLGLEVAPSVHAWQKFLGERPAAESKEVLYADWVHATLKGAYLTACCVYSALTGLSPEGLAFPEGVTPEEAALFQKLGWEAFTETQEAITQGKSRE